MVTGHGVASGLEFVNPTHTCVTHDRDTMVLPIPMIFPSDHIDWSTRTFKEVLPDIESLKDCKQFFVMGVIIEFRGTEGAGMEFHRVDFTGISLNGEDGTQSVIGSISFYNDRFIRDPVGQDRCRDESGFQGLEGFLCGIGKVPRNTLVGQPGKWNHYVGIIRNEAVVKISESKK